MKKKSKEKNTILYIEDNCSNLRIVAAILKMQSNILLLSAMEGEYGLELANDYLPELILLDINLPDMNGYEILDELKSKPATKDIPVIAVTADAMLDDVERGFKAGFRHYITKPIKLDFFVETINKVLDEYEKCKDEVSLNNG